MGYAAKERFGRKKSQPTPIDQVLDGTLRHFGIDKDIARYNFVLHWEQIVGSDIATRTRPECIRNKTLIIRVLNSAWAQELSFQKDIILKRLRKFMQNKCPVNDVMFYVGDL